MSTPDAHYDPFTSHTGSLSMDPVAPSFNEVVGGLSIPSYFGGGPKTNVTAEPLPVPPPLAAPSPVTADSVLSTAQSWNLETLEAVRKRLTEVADNKRYRDILTEKVRQRAAVMNPVTDQILVILSDNPVWNQEIPFVLETKSELQRLLQAPTELIEVRRALPAVLIQTLEDWHGQISQIYVNPVAEWATWLLGETNEQ